MIISFRRAIACSVHATERQPGTGKQPVGGPTWGSSLARSVTVIERCLVISMSDPWARTPSKASREKQLYCRYAIQHTPHTGPTTSTRSFGAACTLAMENRCLRMKPLLTVQYVIFVKCKNQNENLQTDIIPYSKNTSCDDKIVYNEAKKVPNK